MYGNEKGVGDEWKQKKLEIKDKTDGSEGGSSMNEKHRQVGG